MKSRGPKRTGLGEGDRVSPAPGSDPNGDAPWVGAARRFVNSFGLSGLKMGMVEQASPLFKQAGPPPPKEMRVSYTRRSPTRRERRLRAAERARKAAQVREMTKAQRTAEHERNRAKKERKPGLVPVQTSRYGDFVQQIPWESRGGLKRG